MDEVHLDNVQTQDEINVTKEGDKVKYQSNLKIGDRREATGPDTMLQSQLNLKLVSQCLSVSAIFQKFTKSAK